MCLREMTKFILFIDRFVNGFHFQLDSDFCELKNFSYEREKI